MLAATAAAAQTAPPPDGYVACHFYSIEQCTPPNWQNQGYPNITACKNAYFNYCYYGDPLPGDADWP